MTSEKSHLEIELERKLLKALGRFDSSLKRVVPLKNSVEEFSDEELGDYEELMSRFARLSDLFLSQYLRLRVQQEDPAFRGSFKDVLNQSEKLGLITSGDEWFKIRELRNKQAHEYEESDLIALFVQVLQSKPLLQSIPRIFRHET